MGLIATSALFATATLLALAFPAATLGQSGAITSDVPATVDPAAVYLIYLHGRIIEVQGRRPTHPEFGVYEYDAILEEFAGRGFHVISEVRPADTQVAEYAEKVAGQVRRLVEAGVPSENIIVTGFSKGGMIAIATSSRLRMPGVRYVILAGCIGATSDDDGPGLSGRVLSIHEASDTIGRSCAPLFDRSPDAVETAEVRIDTGARHGAFYQPRKEWLEPMFSWIGGAGGAAPGGATSTELRVGLVLQPYTARPGADEISIAPDLLEPGALALLEEMELQTPRTARVELSAEEAASYGVWQRVSLADARLGREVANMARDGTFVLGLLGNCISSWGMLAGLQRSDPAGGPREVGLIWIDAHGDFNTPETTLSGWLGGMPVSVAAGQSLQRMRLTAGIDPPISTRNIVMMGLRDVDPLEQILLDDSDITTVSAADMIGRTDVMTDAIAGLAERVDVIYLHVDLDILDAAEIPGSFFETAGGPTAEQVAAVLRELTGQPKVGALGIASFPTAEEGRDTSMRSAMMLIRAA
ncbi:MAG: arginase family protein, partial [Gemmatimonadota bacterium]